MADFPANSGPAVVPVSRGRRLLNPALWANYLLVGVGLSVKEVCQTWVTWVFPGTPIHPEVRHRFKESCDRPGCPQCFRSALWRDVVSQKLRFQYAMRALGEYPRHWVISPSVGDLEKGEMHCRRLLLKYLKELGLAGGYVVLHHLRSEGPGKAYLSPHYHGILFGHTVSSEHIRLLSAKSGWLFKDLGGRKTPGEIQATLWYELNHAATLEGRLIAFSFGILSNRTLKHTLEARNLWVDFTIQRNALKARSHPCPLCGDDHGHASSEVWIGLGKPPPLA